MFQLPLPRGPQTTLRGLRAERGEKPRERNELSQTEPGQTLTWSTRAANLNTVSLSTSMCPCTERAERERAGRRAGGGSAEAALPERRSRPVSPLPPARTDSPSCPARPPQPQPEPCPPYSAAAAALHGMLPRAAAPEPGRSGPARCQPQFGRLQPRNVNAHPVLRERDTASETGIYGITDWLGLGP